MEQELTEFEQLVARMFFNVGVQSSLALEDPNQRFGIEFQHQDAIDTPPAAKFENIQNKSYVTKTDAGTATLITNPKDLPATTRVVMQGGNAVSVIKALDGAFAQADKYKVQEGAPFPVSAGNVAPKGSGNRFMTLILNEEFKAEHDVAVLFAWGGISDSRVTLDLMTWPMDKSVDAQS